jgi:hypothetical protein
MNIEELLIEYVALVTTGLYEENNITCLKPPKQVMIIHSHFFKC